MNLLDRITSIDEAMSFRDHVAKTLQGDLTLNFKQRKLDELTAHLLGARDWNSVIGKLSTPPVTPVSRFNPSVHPEDIIKVVEFGLRNSIDPFFVYNFQAAAFSLIEQYLDFVRQGNEEGMARFDYRKFRESELIQLHLTAISKGGTIREETIHGYSYQKYIVELCAIGARCDVINALVDLEVPKKWFMDRDFLEHMSYLTEAQVEQATSCILDSSFAPEDLEMEAFRYDSELREKLFAHIENRKPDAASVLPIPRESK